jgi:hypothetical protein
MGYSSRPLAQEDIKGAMDRAVESERGVRVRCSSRSEAIIMRARANSFRARVRKENRLIYEVDHPMHNNSVYDCIRMTLEPGDKGPAREDGSVDLLLTRVTVNDLTIEDL